MPGVMDNAYCMKTMSSATASFTTNRFDVRNFHEGNFSLAVTGRSGATATLDVAIQGYDPATDIWYDLIAFGQQSSAASASSESAAVTSNLPEYIRVSGTIAGTNPAWDAKVGAVLK
jgi:phage gp45-like